MNITTPLLVFSAIVLASLESFGAKPFEEMDFGRFLTASFHDKPGKEDGKLVDGKNTLNGAQRIAANKGIAVQLGKNEGGMIFDTDLLRVSGGWTGSWIRLNGVAFDGKHGPNPSAPADANVYFGTKPMMPGWSLDGSFKDPRKLPTGPGAAKVPFGPLPREMAKYYGLSLHGDDVVFAYTVGKAALLELLQLEKAGDQTVLTRTFKVLQTGGAAHALLATTMENQTATIEDSRAVIHGDGEDAKKCTVISLIGGPAGAKIEVNEDRVTLKLPLLLKDATFKIVYAKGDEADLPKLVAATKQPSPILDLVRLTSPGPAHWPEVITTHGKRGEGPAPYVVDTIPVPTDNPYKSWLRFASLDFFKDGRAALGTWNGDVWIVSGLDGDLQNVRWKRFATGIFHALGLRIVDDVIYVLGRDQITRLRDLNQDGEADRYECFNNDVQVTPGFHEFAFDLQTDPAGNFYFSKAGPVNPGGRGWGPLSDHNGCIFKISKDGQKFEVFATGVRAPNGIGAGPNGEITTGDNQGTWVPACYVHLVKPGDFLGVCDLAHRDPPPPVPGQHICYFPMSFDNSSGGQVWVTSKRWGPLSGKLLHMTYGKSGVIGIVFEKIGDITQGGAFRFPLKLDTGAMRPRFNPVDGQLYVTGLKGWQTDAAKETAFQRVRYTGGKVYFPSEMHVTDQGIHLSFYEPLDPTTAGDLQNYDIEQWNYRWTKEYGSPDYKVSNPEEQGRDKVDIQAIDLSPDHKSVFLKIPGLRPVDQMRIRLNVKGEDGTLVPNEIVNTINVVPPESAPGKTYSALK